MLKLVEKSSNKKLGNCAATYRSGIGDVYSTCPSTCILKPTESGGSTQVNSEYLAAVIDAVPSGGVSWTYTHFPKEVIPTPVAGKTCINISTDDVEQALASKAAGYPTVVVRPTTELGKVDIYSGVRFVRCPAEYNDVTCATCGGDRPLCARPERNYVIKFTAHGTGAKKINVRTEGGALAQAAGGCYGNSGPVRLQWEKTKGSTTEDATAVLSFARRLPEGTKLRHHVVGDLG